ncbi:MAG: selenocysteine-specific translation elongation factor [Tissierellia bacterium]|nr:selenocysteine-specific translation elongation factor [Tissierellia bacterium]
MKHIIVGTAGHIDHGKTTLIKALTGRNTDRLEEEQKRGISIDLGFTYMDLPSGDKVGIIDAPGHERFIKNMLAGVMGIDIVMLIIAADEGIMPQTVEHLNILDLIGVKAGFVVLTKIDMVEDEWIEMVEEEIRENTEGTFLEEAKIIRVSSTKGTGVKSVIEEIEKISDTLENTEDNKLPRLPIDRVFTIKGFGTIVTGTLISGVLNVNDEVEVYPTGKTSKIRSLQVHDMDVKTAYSGQRVAINLPALKKNEIERGNLIAPPDSMIPSMMFDAKLKLLEDSVKSIKNRTRVRLYIGSDEVLARVVLVDRDELLAGEEAVVQFRLEKTSVALRGDKFIVRFYSPMFTIGGGEIIDANPKKRKRFNEEDISDMEMKATLDDISSVETIIKEHSPAGVSLKDIVKHTSMKEDELLDIISDLIDKEKIISFNMASGILLAHKDFYTKIKKEIISFLEVFHKNNTFKKGAYKEEILSKYFKDKKSGYGDKLLHLIADEGLIKIEQSYVSLKDFNVVFNESEEDVRRTILVELDKNGFNLVKKNDFLNSLNTSKSITSNIFLYLIQEGQVKILNEDLLISKEIYEKAKNKLIKFLHENNKITLAEYRDELETNRRSAMSLLDQFDIEGITLRNEDFRILNSTIGDVL